MSRAAGVTVRAPAKVNLAARGRAAAPDGYHALATVFHAVSLYDEVTATAGGGGPHASDGDRQRRAARRGRRPAGRAQPGRPRGPAARPRPPGAFEPRAPAHPQGHPGRRRHGRRVADAAAALVACDALWKAGLSRDELLELAAELGADVPFALLGGTAVGTGRGTELTPALARGDYDWVVALAEVGLSTPAVYRELDRLRAGRVLPEPRVPSALMQALRRGDAESVGALLANDLQPAARLPAARSRAHPGGRQRVRRARRGGLRLRADRRVPRP